jgi:hypothetical protein
MKDLSIYITYHPRKFSLDITFKKRGTSGVVLWKTSDRIYQTTMYPFDELIYTLSVNQNMQHGHEICKK